MILSTLVKPNYIEKLVSLQLPLDIFYQYKQSVYTTRIFIITNAVYSELIDTLHKNHIYMDDAYTNSSIEGVICYLQSMYTDHIADEIVLAYRIYECNKLLNTLID